MIEFEGFELVHPESGQLNKGLRTQPYIQALMELFGAKKGSTTKSKTNKLTSWQEEGYQDTLSDLSSGPSSSFTSYTPSAGPTWSPTGAGDGSAPSVNFAGTWGDVDKPEWEGQEAGDYTPKSDFAAAERYQSIEGLNDLRSFKAKNTYNPNAQMNALMELGERGSIPYEQRLANVLEKANKDLTSADIQNRRSGVMGGTTARNAALGAMGEKYARTVGRSAAAFAEESEAERMNRALRSFGMAGDIGLRSAGLDLQGQGMDLAARGQDAQYNLGRGNLEAQQAMYGHGAAQSNLQYRQGLEQQDRQFAGNYGLQREGLGNQRYGINAGMYGTDVGARSSRYASDTARYGTDANLADSALNRMSREGLAQNQFGLDSWQMQEQASQRAAMMENDWNTNMENSRINRLRTLGGLQTTPIFDTTITRNKGSAGLLPSLITAGAGLAFGPAGAMAGGALASGMSQGYGDGGGSTGSGNLMSNPYAMYGMMNSGGGDDMSFWKKLQLMMYSDSGDSTPGGGR